MSMDCDHKYKEYNCSHKSKCCDTCRPMNCSRVLDEFHRLIEEAECAFNKADKIQNKVLYDLLDNLLDLEESLDLYKSGKYKVLKGEKLLEYSHCKFDCNKNCCKCRGLKREAISLYSCKEKEILESIYLLKKLICTLKSAIGTGKEGDKVYEEYKKCIHS
ncbi:MAG: hypothetical protein RR645_03605 [Clostridium sp.]